MSMRLAKDANRTAATRVAQPVPRAPLPRPCGCAVRWIAAGALLSALWCTGLYAPVQLAYADPPPQAQSEANPVTPKLAFPELSLRNGVHLKWLGEISTDGRIRDSRFNRLFMRPKKTRRPSGDSDATTYVQSLQSTRERKEKALQENVPPDIERQKSAQPIEDFQPPEHATQPAKGRTLLGSMMDSLVGVAYGNKRILVAPDSVTTDAQHRVIIADAAAHSVHVLSRDAKKSFQIVGGEGRRLQSPTGVAVDGEDNIYVSDSRKGLIFVYDSAGRFIRTMGSYGEEGIFHSPAGLAIDPKAGRLYVVDPPIHTLFIFDLNGMLLKRVEPRGGEFSERKGSPAPGQFQSPRSVLVHNGEVVVRDATRIHILDLQGKLLKEFPVPAIPAQTKGPVPGFFMDKANHIFVGDGATMTVRMYTHDGKLLDAFGRAGLEAGEFSLLSGMWATPGGRVYIIDGNRLQIFRLKNP